MLYFLCFVFPPLAVLCTGRFFSFLLNCILTLFFVVPGIIHAVLIVQDHIHESRSKRNDNKNITVIY